MNDDFNKRMALLLELDYFLSVPDEALKSCDWTDVNGKDIECNIYDPKYGEQYKADFFQGVHYEDKSTGEQKSAKYCHHLLCDHGNNKYTNKDNIEVIKRPPPMQHKRMAQTSADFEIIFKRERNNSNSDKVIDEKIFKENLLEVLNDKVNEYKKVTPAKYRDVIILTALDLFSKWLVNNKQLQPSKLDYKLLDIISKIKKEKFLESEAMLFEHSYITAEHSWKQEKNLLVAFIIQLDKKAYFQGSLNKRANRKKIREFFEERYSMQIEKQFQEKYIIDNDLDAQSKFKFAHIVP